MNVIEKLQKQSEPLIVSVKKDHFIEASEKAFDCTFNGTSTFHPWSLPQCINSYFKIGVIVGSSGSGKSTLLNQIIKSDYRYIDYHPKWADDLSILSHFNTPAEGINKLGAVGLNSIPSWYKPYRVLSNGEKFRADLARKIDNHAVIDEFTSVVDRNVAKAASVAFSKYIKENNITNVIISTCHEDIIDWLEPDWVINTNLGEVYDGFFLNDQISISKYIAQAVISGPCLKNIII